MKKFVLTITVFLFINYAFSQFDTTKLICYNTISKLTENNKLNEAQAEKNAKITGLYKLYNKTYGKDSVFMGFINFYNKNQYYFFGKTAYNTLGSSARNFFMSSKGSWNINEANILFLKDDKRTSPAIGFEKPDSVSYQASLRKPYDTIFFQYKFLMIGVKLYPVK